MDRPLTRPRATGSVLLCLWAVGAWTAWAGPDTRPSPATATAAAPAKMLLHDSLTHQARSLGHLRDGATVGRGGRIMVLLKCADRLVPGRAQTAGPMVDLYEGLGDLERAAASARVCVDANPIDYAMGLRWLRLAQAISPSADKRIALLAAALDRKDLDAGIRAAAGVDLCGVYLRQGDKTNAAATCARALQLDPTNSALLEAQARLDGREGQAQSFEIALAAVRGSPRSLDAAWKVAQRLQGAGLYDSALTFYEHAAAIAEAIRPGDAVVEALHVDRFNAALDAAPGKPEEAIKAFTPALNAYPRSLPLRALMVEAARLAGKDQEVAKHVQAMAKVYEPLSMPAAPRTAARSAELAWFALYYRSAAKEAIRWAREAARSDGGDRFVQRVLGACELANGDTAAGQRRLAGLVGKDPFAAAILARHYYDAGKAGQGAKTLQAGIGTIRTGPGWRALAGLASEKKIPVPPPAHAQAVKKALARLPQIVLEMGRAPEKFIQVKLAASPAQVGCGQAIRVDVELKNVSVHPLPLGQQGLFYPVVFLSLSAEGGAKAVFPNLTRARLPAPKVLAAGASVRQTVRLDVGPAEGFLMADPLTDLRLTVTGLLDPLQEADKFISSVPGATITPVTIRRKGLFDPAGDVEAAKAALGRIVRDIRKADPATQLRAARQTVSLLAYVRQVEKRKAKSVLPNLLQKSLVLALTKALAESPAEAVQAEILTALHHVDLDEPTIAQLAPCLQARSPIVRMRLVELLVAKKTPGHETVLDMFAMDDDPLVREMAAAVSAKK